MMMRMKMMRMKMMMKKEIVMEMKKIKMSF
jgi:hypothetical protein